MDIKGVVAAIFMFLTLAARAADESSIVLQDGPDADLTRARCSICHSPDYIPMNSVFLTRAGWDAEVHKMIKVMGAPISEEEAARIINYLANHYGDG